MKIEKNKHVSLIYELREEDGKGKVIESLDSDTPLSFVYGAGRMIAGFEAGLSSISEGDDFSFTVPFEEAYGGRREDMIIDVPVEIFYKNGVLDESICFVGNNVPMADSQGRRIDGVVNEITSGHVRMDFNHPMAGCNLHFTGKVLTVRDASPSELQGSDHGAGCSGCSGHSHDCSGQC
ncbi:MAG: peptidylprolyl isomerase [Bacteroidetes bacterium]|nr:peptidylprolyl isomerase [Bacteroidota bacterium]